MKSRWLAVALPVLWVSLVMADPTQGTSPQPAGPAIQGIASGESPVSGSPPSASVPEAGAAAAPMAEAPAQEEEAQAKKRRERLLWRPMAVPEEEAVSPLVAMALSPDPALRARAIEGLVASRSSELIPFVVYALSDPDPHVRDKALRALFAMGPDQVTEAIIAVLAWGEPAVVAGVDAALPSIRSIVEPGLLRCLDAPASTSAEQIAAAYGLGRIASRRALEPLDEKVWGDNESLSIYAANAIVAIDDAGSLQTLVSIVQHPNPSVRRAAYYGIARIGGPEALNLLTAAASPGGEADVRVKREVIRYLGLVGNKSTVHFLMGLVRAKSGFVQPAIEALELITGMPHGLAGERWVEWYNETFNTAESEVSVAPPPLVPVPGRSPIPGVPPQGLPILPQ